MDGILCHHRSPCCSAQGPVEVLDGGPLDLIPRGTDGGAEAERPAGGGGPDKEHSGGPSLRRTLTAM